MSADDTLLKLEELFEECSELASRLPLHLVADEYMLYLLTVRLTKVGRVVLEYNSQMYKNDEMRRKIIRLLDPCDLQKSSVLHEKDHEELVKYAYFLLGLIPLTLTTFHEMQRFNEIKQEITPALLDKIHVQAPFFTAIKGLKKYDSSDCIQKIKKMNTEIFNVCRMVKLFGNCFKIYECLLILISNNLQVLCKDAAENMNGQDWAKKHSHWIVQITHDMKNIVKLTEYITTPEYYKQNRVFLESS
jgi:hypothetical protein